MADLFDRLFPESPGEDKIPVHYFHAAMTDYAAGYTTRQEMIVYWGLDAQAQTDLNVLCDAVDALGTVAARVRWLVELHCVMLLAEAGAKYNIKATFAARMGLI